MTKTHYTLTTCTFFNSTFPDIGQLGGGTISFFLHSASDGITVNCFILSTETILFSIKQLMYIAKYSTALRDSPYDSAKPTFSAKTTAVGHF